MAILPLEGPSDETTSALDEKETAKWQYGSAKDNIDKKLYVVRAKFSLRCDGNQLRRTPPLFCDSRSPRLAACLCIEHAPPILRMGYDGLCVRFCWNRSFFFKEKVYEEKKSRCQPQKNFARRCADDLDSRCKQNMIDRPDSSISTPPKGVISKPSFVWHG